MGIAHIIKKRLFYTYEINKIMKMKRNKLSIEHFLRIPVIYTWTTTAVIAGSIFYFLIVFNFNYNYALTCIMITCIISLFIFPKTNIKFYQEISNYINELKKIDKIKFPTQTYYDLFILQFLICSIFIYVEISYYFFDNLIGYKLYLYPILFGLLIIIEYIFIKRRTRRKMIFSDTYNKIRNLLSKKLS
jgi:hypothetical protein